MVATPAGATGSTPTISSVNDAVAVATTGTLTTVTIDGSNFDLPKVTIAGGTKVKRILAGSTATHLALSVKLPPPGTAALGSQTVTVANKHGGSTSSSIVINAAPVVSSVSPTNLYKGGTTTITVTGTGFASNATLAPVSGMTFSDYSVTDGGTKLHATATVKPKPSPARRAIVVRNPADHGFSAVNMVGFTFLELPRVDSLYYIGQGSEPQLINVSGLPTLGVGESPAVSLSGTGATLSAPSYSGTTFSATLTVADNAVVGARALTITMPDGSVITNPRGIFVNAAPTVDSIGSVTSFYDGRDQVIAIRGKNFASNTVGTTQGVNIPTVTVDSASVYVINVSYVSSTLMWVTLFTDQCISGDFDLTVTNPGTAGGRTTISQGLSVGMDLACPSTPLVDAISSVLTDQTDITVGITGSDFQVGMSVWTSDPTIADVTAVDVTSDTGADLTVTTGSSTGTVTVYFMNPDGGTTTAELTVTS